MSRRLFAMLVIAALGGVAALVEIPAGTQIQIRLTSTIDSTSAKAKEPFTGVVIAAVFAGGRIALPQGTKVTGMIEEVTPPASAKESAVLKLRFEDLVSSSGAKTPFAAKLIEIDNARESVDDQGRILGIVASQTASARLDQGISKVAQRFPGLGELLGTAKGAVVKEADPAIRYEPGVEMNIELTRSVHWDAHDASLDVKAIAGESELNRLIARQPAQTTAANPPRPSDLTNLLFIGGREVIEEAFKDAGWFPADPLTGTSKLETFKAIVEMRGYKDAPVSTLLLDGRPPDLVFQKQNNTFAQRHHLRLWLRPELFHGKQVWVCAATHDIGIDYSEENRTFIHRVDPKIDKERAKVVNDLLFTGRVRGLALADRTNVPESGHNATGDPFETDRRMAVIEF